MDAIDALVKRWLRPAVDIETMDQDTESEGDYEGEEQEEDEEESGEDEDAEDAEDAEEEQQGDDAPPPPRATKGDVIEKMDNTKGKAADGEQDVRLMASSAMTQPTDGPQAPGDASAPTAPPGASSYSPWSDPTYRNFRQVLEATAEPIPGEGAGSADHGDGGGTYHRLMATETRVLDTVDRVVNDARFVEAHDAQFLNQSLSTILNRTALAVLDTFSELMSARSLKHVILAMTRDERPLYLGLALLVVTLIIICLA